MLDEPPPGARARAARLAVQVSSGLFLMHTIRYNLLLMQEFCDTILRLHSNITFILIPKAVTGYFFESDNSNKTKFSCASAKRYFDRFLNVFKHVFNWLLALINHVITVIFSF